MAQKDSGVLPVQILKRFAEAKNIKGIPTSYFNPASVDLPLSREAYRLEGTFLPLPGETVRDNLKSSLINAKAHDLNNPLEVGVLYIIRIEGKFNLPRSVYGYINPKSSTGRINLFCRVVADGVHYYDTIQPAGWKGEMWVLVRPDSFPVKLSPGIALTQLRLFDDYTILDKLDIELAANSYHLLWKPSGTPYRFNEINIDNDGSIFLTLDLTNQSAGFECRNPSKILDVSKKYSYLPGDFFNPIPVERGHVFLRKGRFYILSTLERVLVPPALSAEIRPIDVRFGEFRTHAAGYVDPGWGWGKKGEAKGQSLTLEVIPYEDVIIRRGQTVGRLRFEKMKEVPDVVYSTAQSHYANQQGARLSKNFKQ